MFMIAKSTYIHFMIRTEHVSNDAKSRAWARSCIDWCYLFVFEWAQHLFGYGLAVKFKFEFYEAFLRYEDFYLKLTLLAPMQWCKPDQLIWRK